MHVNPVNALALVALAPMGAQQPIAWEGPAGCPDAAQVERRVAARLGRPIVDGEIAAQATVRREGFDYALDLVTTIEGHTESRNLRAETCDALADVTALVVALALDPLAVSGRYPGGENPAPAPAQPDPVATTVRRRVGPIEPEPSADFPEEPPEKLQKRRRRRVEFERDRSAPRPKFRRGPVRAFVLRVGGGGELGALPGGAGGVALDFGIAWRNALVEVGGRYWIPRRQDIDGGGTLRVQLGTAAVRGCGRWGNQTIAAILCAGLEAGGLRGEATGVDVPRSTTGPWFGGTASGGVSWWFTPALGLRADVEAFAPFVRSGLELAPATPDDDPTELFTPAPVGGRILLGLQGRVSIAGQPRRKRSQRDGSAAGRRTP